MPRSAPPETLRSGTDPRRDEASAWVAEIMPETPFELVPASADASFRRYFRVIPAAGLPTRIVMDAPPAREDCRPFVKVAGLFADAGLNVPAILAQDLERGFLLLSDLGTRTFLELLRDADAPRADQLFRSAIEALITWQASSRPGVLPPYDAALLRRELDLFPEWFLSRHLELSLDDAERAGLESVFARLIESALGQPRTFVHRDFMPRNLMESVPNPGILDFQDAVEGPISYDVISLFRDAFISWDEERTLDWTIRYWEGARRAGLPVRADFSEFWREAEWMGLQRHLKVLGIFCRLNYRDGKDAYLADLPRFLHYARHVAARYHGLAPLLGLLDRIENKGVAFGYTF